LIGAILAEAGDAAIDDARIDLAQAVVIDAEPGLDVGAEIFDHHVGLFHKPPKHFEALPVLQVERHGPLVPVQVLEIGTMPRAARLFAGGILHQGIDLDDIGAPVRKLPHTGRPGADPGKVEHGEAGQGGRGMWGRHLGTPVSTKGEIVSRATTIAESPRLVMRLVDRKLSA
jgi:hypothetical protein